MASADKITLVLISEIEPSPFQYRRAMSPEELENLAASIKERGLLQPVLVREISGKRSQGTRFQLVAGHRRWYAAEAAGLERIPSIVKILSDVESAEIALIENAQREDPDEWSTAEGIRKVLELHAKNGVLLPETKLAAKLGKSVGFVRNHLGLFNLHPDLKALVKRKASVMSSALYIQKVAGTEHLAGLIEKAESGASYRTIEALVNATLAENARKRTSHKAPDKETGQRTKAQSERGGGQMSRGRQVTTNNAKQAAEEIDRALPELARHMSQIRAWMPHATAEKRAKVKVKLAEIHAAIDAIL